MPPMSLQEILHLLSIPTGLDASVSEVYDTDALRQARSIERMTVIAYEAARSADARLRPWNYLAPCERRLWRGRFEVTANMQAGSEPSGVSKSATHDRAWIVFDTITSALLRATPRELADALAVFDEATPRPPTEDAGYAPASRQVHAKGATKTGPEGTSVWRPLSDDALNYRPAFVARRVEEEPMFEEFTAAASAFPTGADILTLLSKKR